LDFSPLKEHFKWITGYSDVTVLHNAMAKEDLPSLHATMPINFSTNDSESLAMLKEIFINAKLPEYQFDSHPLNRAGNVEAPIVGGNLSVLYSLRGTHFDLNVSGKILFIEDLDEYLYHIDRMLINFRLAGWFNKIKGLVIGGMEDMHDNTIPFGKNAREIVADVIKDFDFPVAFVNGIGHTKQNLPLALGITSTLVVDEIGARIIY
jgi:muramoyltetrapeptide carboxypeptidase